MKEEIKKLIDEGKINEIVKRGLNDKDFASAAVDELLVHENGPNLLAKILTRLG